MGRWKQLGDSLGYGLGKMSSVAILLVGTGAIAGIIKASSLNADLIALLGEWHIGGMLIAPIAGALMSAATASTTAGAVLKSMSATHIGRMSSAGFSSHFSECVPRRGIGSSKS